MPATPVDRHPRGLEDGFDARTGEATGERPYSVWKIVAAVVGVIALIVAIIFVIRAVQ